jgi:hypothetical protein
MILIEAILTDYEHKMLVVIADMFITMDSLVISHRIAIFL